MFSTASGKTFVSGPRMAFSKPRLWASMVNDSCEASVTRLQSRQELGLCVFVTVERFGSKRIQIQGPTSTTVWLGAIWFPAGMLAFAPLWDVKLVKYAQPLPSI